MMEHNLTPEQKRIFLFIKKRSENILINAYAGTGKTFTIVNALKLLPPNKTVIFLAFNKHIQLELKEKVPENVKCCTTYSIGLSAIKGRYGNKIDFDEFKIDKIIQNKSKKWNLNKEFENENEISLYLESLKKLVNFCRLSLILKEEQIPIITKKHDIFYDKPKDVKRVLNILDETTKAKNTYDFIDMIFLPAIDTSIHLPKFDYIFVDEVQDLNKCQIRIIEKLFKKDKISNKIISRLITVGDEYQNIYGFNGTDEYSFNWFKTFPNTKILPLSVSFRCSKNVIKKAQEIVPNIKALDSAVDGEVRDGDVLNEADDGDFVLCRTTMPLVALFFEFLKKEKKAIIKGSDIGLQLIDFVKNFKTLDEMTNFWINELNKYKDELIKTGILNPNEHSGFVAFEDKINVLIFLSKLSNNINDLIDKIKFIFTDEIKGICLSTIHKVKGLEADRVFIIRPDLLPLKNVKDWEVIQERNLEYVAYTRAKKELIFDRNWSDINLRPN